MTTLRKTKEMCDVCKKNLYRYEEERWSVMVCMECGKRVVVWKGGEDWVGGERVNHSFFSDRELS